MTVASPRRVPRARSAARSASLIIPLSHKPPACRSQGIVNGDCAKSDEGLRTRNRNRSARRVVSLDAMRRLFVRECLARASSGYARPLRRSPALPRDNPRSPHDGSRAPYRRRGASGLRPLGHVDVRLGARSLPPGERLLLRAHRCSQRTLPRATRVARGRRRGHMPGHLPACIEDRRARVARCRVRSPRIDCGGRP